MSWSTVAAVCSLGTLLLQEVCAKEFCMGYFDYDGEYHKGFSCSSSCCGEGKDQYCCSRDKSEVTIRYSSDTFFFIVIGCVVGGVILISLFILLCCCFCVGCPGYKRRQISRGQVIRTQQPVSTEVMYQTVPTQANSGPSHDQTNVYTPQAGGPPQGYPPHQGYAPHQGYPPAQSAPYPQPYNSSYPPTQGPPHFGEAPSSIEMSKRVEANAPPPPYDY